jgi:aldehyde:ferredoxin oxidoreductase
MASRFSGYVGKMLDINLTTGAIGEYPVSDEDRERFVSGRLLSTKIPWDELRSGTDPLSPDNILIIMTSPLAGTGAPASNRFDISAKSPLTGAVGHSNSGGNFGMNLKKAGWDGMIVCDRAQAPVYIEAPEVAKGIIWLLTRAWLVVATQIWTPPRFMRFHLSLLAHSKALEEATGMRMDFGRFLRVGERGYTLERMFNLRAGIGSASDTLPKRFTDDALPGVVKKAVVPIKSILPKYYRLRGWDADGIPKKKTLKKLGLDFVDLDAL